LISKFFVYAGRCIVLFFAFAIVFFVTAKAHHAQAANCGGATVCQCGDTITSNYIFPADLTCTGTNGLYTGADSITIDGANHTLKSTNATPNMGIDLENANVTVKNIRVENFGSGIDIYSTTNATVEDSIFDSNRTDGIASTLSSGTTIQNSTFNRNNVGISFDWSNDLSITDNTFTKNNSAIGNSAGAFSTGLIITGNIISRSANYGLYLRAGFYGDPTISNNTLYLNHKDIYYKWDPDSEIISSNNYLHNTVSQAISGFTMNRKTDAGVEVSFSFTMKDKNDADCSSCTYTLETYPDDSITSSKVGALVTGSFTPTLEGTNSLLIEIIDSYGNTTERKYSILVGDTTTEAAEYYLSPNNLVNVAFGYSPRKGLVKSAPDNTYTWASDQSTINHQIDEIANYPFSIITSIDTSIWYKNSKSATFYYNSPDESINSTTSHVLSGSYANIIETVSGLNWMADYPSDWYQLALDTTVSAGGTSNIQTSIANPSSLTYNYEHSIMPQIKGLTDGTVVLLSANEKGSGSFEVTLKNILNSQVTTESNFVNLAQPFTGGTTSISETGDNVLAVDLAGNETKVLDTASMNISASGGTVDVTVSTWETSGNYTKEWQEDSETHNVTTTHEISGNKANTTYEVLVGGTSIGTYESDGSGIFSFSYDGGFSSRSFEVVEQEQPSPTPTPTVTVTDTWSVEETSTCTPVGSPVTILPETGSSKPDFAVLDVF